MRGMMESPGSAYAYECSTGPGFFVSVAHLPNATLIDAVCQETFGVGDHAMYGRSSVLLRMVVTWAQQPMFASA